MLDQLTASDMLPRELPAFPRDECKNTENPDWQLEQVRADWRLLL
jgi:hypothetical protein